MSEEEEEEDDDTEEEKKRLDNLGVGSTWGILTDKEKQKKEPEKKPAFRGFK